MIKINTLDFVIILILGLYLIGGFRDGLLKQIAGFIGYIAAFLGALYGSKPLGIMLTNIFSSGDTFIGDSQIEIINEGIPGFDFIPGMNAIISVISFILLFIVLQILIGIIVRKMKIFNRVPLIGPLNILGGMAIGALKGLIFIFILIAVISLLPLDYVGDLVSGSKLAFSINQIIPDLFTKAKIFFLEHYHVIIK
ncbi:MAG: CvpA family protein [Dethiobacteria bacterium]